MKYLIKSFETNEAFKCRPLLWDTWGSSGVKGPDGYRYKGVLRTEIANSADLEDAGSMSGEAYIEMGAEGADDEDEVDTKKTDLKSLIETMCDLPFGCWSLKHLRKKNPKN